MNRQQIGVMDQRLQAKDTHLQNGIDKINEGLKGEADEREDADKKENNELNVEKRTREGADNEHGTKITEVKQLLGEEVNKVNDKVNAQAIDTSRKITDTEQRVTTQMTQKLENEVTSLKKSLADQTSREQNEKKATGEAIDALVRIEESKRNVAQQVATMRSSGRLSSSSSSSLAEGAGIEVDEKQGFGIEEKKQADGKEKLKESEGGKGNGMLRREVGMA